MNAIVTIPARLNEATSTLVTAAATSRGITSEEYVAEAVQRVAEADADDRAFIQAGIDAADRGDVVSHEMVMAEPDAMIAQHRGRCTV